MLLNQRLGLNLGVPANVLAFSDSMLDDRRGLGRLARPVNITTVASHLGCCVPRLEIVGFETVRRTTGWDNPVEC